MLENMKLTGAIVSTGGTAASFFTVFGLLMTFIGSIVFRRYRRLSLKGEHTSGTVIELHWEEIRNGSLVCHPVLAFQTLDGHNIRTKADIGRGKVTSRPGDHVSVVYDPLDPAKAEIDTRVRWATRFGVITMVLGVVLIWEGLFGTASDGVIISGLIFTAAGGAGTREYRKFSRTGERVAGTVVELRWKEVRTTEGPRRTSYPVIDFQTLDGRSFQTVSRIKTGFGNPQPGEQVPVIYDRLNPVKAEIATRVRFAIWFSFMFAMIGVVLLSYGLFRVATGKA